MKVESQVDEKGKIKMGRACVGTRANASVNVPDSA